MKARIVSERSREPWSVHHRSISSPNVDAGPSAGNGSRPSRCRSALRSTSPARRRASAFVRAVVTLSRQRPFPSLNRTYHLPFLTYGSAIARLTRRTCPGALGALIAEFRAAVASVKPEVLSARVRAALDVDASDELSACHVPLLYLGGTEDRILRSAIPAEILAIQPQADVRFLAAPHLILQRRPREAAAALSDFLAQTTSPPPPRTSLGYR